MRVVGRPGFQRKTFVNSPYVGYAGVCRRVDGVISAERICNDAVDITLQQPAPDRVGLAIVVCAIQERRCRTNLDLVPQTRQLVAERPIRRATNDALENGAMRELAQELLQIELPAAIAQLVGKGRDLNMRVGRLREAQWRAVLQIRRGPGAIEDLLPRQSQHAGRKTTRVPARRMRFDFDADVILIGRYLIGTKVELEPANPGFREVAANVVARLADSSVCNPVSIDINRYAVDDTRIGQRPAGDMADTAADTRFVWWVDAPNYIFILGPCITCIGAGEHHRDPAADRHKTTDDFLEAAAPDADKNIPDQYSQNQPSSHSHQHHLAKASARSGGPLQHILP